MLQWLLLQGQRIVASLMWSESKKLLLQQHFTSISFLLLTHHRHGFDQVNCASLQKRRTRMKVLQNRLLRMNVKWPQWAGFIFCWSQKYDVMVIAMSECTWNFLHCFTIGHTQNEISYFLTAESTSVVEITYLLLFTDMITHKKFSRAEDRGSMLDTNYLNFTWNIFV